MRFKSKEMGAGLRPYLCGITAHVSSHVYEYIPALARELSDKNFGACGLMGRRSLKICAVGEIKAL